MTREEKAGWIISIECCVDNIRSELGDGIVEAVYERYGIEDIEDLSTSLLSEVYNELAAIEADME